jgi:hypothetical protein
LVRGAFANRTVVSFLGGIDQRGYPTTGCPRGETLTDFAICGPTAPYSQADGVLKPSPGFNFGLCLFGGAEVLDGASAVSLSAFAWYWVTKLGGPASVWAWPTLAGGVTAGGYVAYNGGQEIFDNC